MLTKHTTTRMVHCAGALAALTILSAVHAGGSTTLTPANNIQATINSGNFTEIVLAPGTYNQTIQLDSGDAPLTIRSQDPTDSAIVASTILDGEFLGSPVIRLTSGGADIVIDGLTIQNGEALGAPGPSDRGGAIDCETASPTVRRCVLRSNEASGVGGAFYINAGNMIFEDTRFEGNTADQGGAVYTNNSTVLFFGCTFDSNVVTEEGGAIAVHAGPISLFDCDFFDNESGLYGGAIITRAGTLLNASRCWFQGNISASTPGNGRGGALYHDGSDNSAINNSVFWNNTANSFGSSIYTVQNITLLSNTHYGDVIASGSGDVIDVPTGGRIDMFNGIIWNFTASGAITGAGTKNVQYCDIEGGFGVAGNIGGDSGDAPMFADAANGDFHLLAGSACIDAGNASKVLGEYPTDYEGAPRALNDPDTPDTGLALLGISVDMGAYEFQPEIIGGPNTCLADIVDSGTFQPPPDGKVDGADLAYLLGSWGTCN